MPRIRGPFSHRAPERQGSSSRRRRQAWLIFLGILVLLAVALWVVRGVLLPFIIAVIIAYVLEPLVSRLETLGVRRFGGVLLAYGVLALAVTGFVRFLVPVLETESTRVVAAINAFVRSAPNYYERLETGIGDFVDSVTASREDGGPVRAAAPVSEAQWGFGPSLERFHEASPPAVPFVREVGLAATTDEIEAAGLQRPPLVRERDLEDPVQHSMTVEPGADGTFGIRFHQAAFEITRGA
ncbi:MAG: AI-2E family transporter, partial [Deltaproteobacteria bacterium]|nr:AI-2E family transporter [Deltaproteobacteria bacterium]